MNKLSQRFTAFFLFAISTGGALTLFQNCAMDPQHLSSSQLSQADFFDYRYTSAPNFFSDFTLLKLSDTNDDFSEFKFVAGVTHPGDLSTPIEYEVRILAPDGTAVCPSQTGALPAGKSSLVFNCVNVSRVTEVRVVLTVSANGKSDTLEKSYR